MQDGSYHVLSVVLLLIAGSVYIFSAAQIQKYVDAIKEIVGDEQFESLNLRFRTADKIVAGVCFLQF